MLACKEKDKIFEEALIPINQQNTTPPVTDQAP